MIPDTLPDLGGIRITQASRDSETGVITLVCDRPLGVTGRISLNRTSRLHMLKDLVGTDLGEGLLELATGNTTGQMHIEDARVGQHDWGCITIHPPRSLTTTVTPLHLLDDILRLAGLPASDVDPQDTSAVLAAIKLGFNHYLAAIEQGETFGQALGCGDITSRNQTSILCTYFDRPLTRHGEVSLTPPQLVRYFRRIIPWMAELLEHLAETKVITGGDIVTSAQTHGMRLFSLSTSETHPTAQDCLEAIVAAAEFYACYAPKEEAIQRVSREERWREGAPPITDLLARIRWRWSLVIRDLAYQAESA